MPRPTPRSPKLLRRAEFGSMAEYLEHVDRFTEYQEMKEAMDKVIQSLNTKYNAEAETVEEKAEHIDEDEEEGEVKHSTKIRQLQTKSNPEVSNEIKEDAQVVLPSGTIKTIKDRYQTCKRSIGLLQSKHGLDQDFLFIIKDNWHDPRSSPRARSAGKYVVHGSGHLMGAFLKGEGVRYTAGSFSLPTEDNQW